MDNRPQTLTGVGRIAVVRALYLGDLLVAVPALRALRAGFPEAEITLIGLPWAEAFVRRFTRLLDRFAIFPGYPGITEVPYDPERTAAFLAEQRVHGYDLAVQMHGSGGASNPFVRALGARLTVGYFEGRDPGLTLGAPYPRHGAEVLRNLGLARLLGCPASGTALAFPLDDGDRAEAAALLHPLEPGCPLVVVHPGASVPARRWPPERFAAVGDELSRRYGAQVVLTGGPAERETVRAVARHMSARPLDVAGRTSLGGLAAIIARAALCISNDTGPAHLADALDTPSVTIFGPAEHERWAALDATRHPIVRLPVACSPCPHRECPIDHRCLRWIRPDMVIAAADRLLAQGTFPCKV